VEGPAVFLGNRQHQLLLSSHPKNATDLSRVFAFMDSAGIVDLPGANFTALFQKSVASSQNLRIIRFIKSVPDLKIPSPVH
jgi:hypothetical protein